MGQQMGRAMVDRSRTTSGGRVMAALAVVVALIAGVFVFGRLASTEALAMVLTTGWFGLVLIGGYLATRRRPDLRLPMGSAYGIVAVSALIWLGLPMLRDAAVNERVATGAPAGEAPGASGNVEVATGPFRAIAHPGSGTASVVELPSGVRKLTFTDFETDNGPDLRVYLSTGDPAKGGQLGNFEDLGALKGNVGDQQYDVPGGIDLDRFSNVVIWCRAFSVGFTSASLSTAESHSRD
jgi:hypothetical protein